MSTPNQEGDPPLVEAKVVGDQPEQKSAAASQHKNHRHRRRSNTKGEGDGVDSSRSASRTNSQSGNKDKPRRKDWTERKSLSQGGKADGENKNNQHLKEKDGNAAHKRTRSSNSNGKRRERDSTRTSSMASNGEGFDYSDEYELDEPFSDSDDDYRPKQPQKLSLIIPRGRIRTLSGTVPVVGYSPKWGGPTMCLSCLQFFDLPEQMEPFEECVIYSVRSRLSLNMIFVFRHLLKEHKIVVSEMGLIVDPKRYVEHWRQRFAKESVDKIFPRVEPKEGEKFFGETDYYYNMSEALPEDYSLRQRLAMRRLEEALSCQQREREDTNFQQQCIFCRYTARGNRSKIIHHLYMIHHLNLGSPDNLVFVTEYIEHLKEKLQVGAREDTNFQQQCIFCRYTARGNRSKIIHHLYMIHHLNLGSPDNLVFVTEYIEHLKEKLQRNECIYCEKTFGDRNILMDHMRKRNHREVNPKNHYYDKFYIINYLELGKRWLDVLAEDFEDTMPTFLDSDEEEEDNSWCEWQEDNVDADETRVVCLLCNESDETCEGLLSHMKDKHEFDLIKLIDDNRLDVYQRMKLINFIRKQNFNAVCFVCQRNDLGNTQELAKHLQETEKPITKLPDKVLWDIDETLVPIFGNDHLLWRLESLLESRDGASDTEERCRRESEKKYSAFVAESQKNTVEGVVAEDLPDLHELNENDLQELM
ncbi:zinc finger, C2H2 type [Ancylostoma caninum]|uniref:Zinc finger, C2H2 type n=1 Tax=Ancylostoma caninum TaxID=29170 RepID=A0A368F862_ANCCA|nr:zinc finger, C2H2 type [Ancylostoma caninum]